MQRYFRLFSFLLLLISVNINVKAFPVLQQIPSDSEWLWYRQPAAQWEETLPLGNGRLGLMPDGGVRKEHFVLNDISLWSGSEADYVNKAASDSLPQIRKLLLDGRNQDAQKLMYSTFVPSASDFDRTYGRYEVLGMMNLEYDLPGDGQPVGYRRWLDLRQGVATTTFRLDGCNYRREYFVSRPKDVIFVHLKADRKAKIGFNLSLSRPERARLTLSEGRLKLSGTLDSGQDGANGVAFSAYCDVFTIGNRARKRIEDTAIKVENADEVWIMISAATTYLYGFDYDHEARRLLDNLRIEEASSWRGEAVEAYRRLYTRTSLKITPTNDVADLPTDERIRRFVTSPDPSLAALYYNYGRYLFISSTRPNTLPPNLQGLWANGIDTPWHGDYHTNINIQMNYWLMEASGLGDLFSPLERLVRRLIPSGEHTAKAFYGDAARGWVLHMMTNVWNYTAPGTHPSWGATNTGGAWLCAHLWEHYTYTGNLAYLQSIYPILKGAAEFFRSTMIREPKHGWLVTAPSSSPENTFYVSQSERSPISVCMGPTMDNQLVHELFGNTINAARLLGIDEAYRDSLQLLLRDLPPMQISKKGYLMEWLEDYEEVDPHHRHVSQLYGLHPGYQISLRSTPELAEAAKATLNRRGDGGTGWSRAWKINFWARLGEGDRAYRLFKSLLTPAYDRHNPRKHGSGTFPNLFCSHQPFQIDGNFGGTSGIIEMLLQSPAIGQVDILPALPSAWGEGRLRGWLIKGGARVDLDWEDGRLRRLILQGGWYPKVTMRLPQGITSFRMNGKVVSVKGGFYELTLAKGDKVRFEF